MNESTLERKEKTVLWVSRGKELGTGNWLHGLQRIRPPAEVPLTASRRKTTQPFTLENPQEDLISQSHSCGARLESRVPADAGAPTTKKGRPLSPRKAPFGQKMLSETMKWPFPSSAHLSVFICNLIARFLSGPVSK